MKRVLSVLTVLFMGACLFAQSLTVDSVCNQLSKHPITKGEFTQIKTINSAKGKRELKSTGNFIFCMDGIMWQTLKPFPTSMIIGTDFIAQVAADGSKTVTDTSDNQTFASVAETISSIFSNNSQKLNASFNIVITDKGNNNWLLALTPKDKTIASVLKTIDLYVYSDSQTATLTSIVMTEASDNQTAYQFANHTYPKELTADEKAYFVSK